MEIDKVRLKEKEGIRVFHDGESLDLILLELTGDDFSRTAKVLVNGNSNENRKPIELRMGDSIQFGKYGILKYLPTTGKGRRASFSLYLYYDCTIMNLENMPTSPEKGAYQKKTS